MSCEAGANRIARWASQLGAGIAQLANKRAFYAGVGLGGAGLLGTGLIALARRQSARRQIAGRRNKKEQRTQESQEQVTMRPIPQLPTRTKIGPTSYLSSSDRCVGCQTPGTGKQGAWYAINGRTYCQDCAPEAARQANVDLVVPEREGAGTGSPARDSATSLVTARPSGERVRIPVRRGETVSSRWSSSPYLPPERRVETRLAQSRLRLNVGQDPNGRPAWFVVNNGHVILRPDGSDTGLAITPALKLGQVKEGLQEVEEDTGRWWLTHIPSGKTLGSRPYASLAEAQLLGSVLAQLDWTRPENEISDQEISQVSETMRRYNQALGEEQVGVKAEVKGPSLQSQPQPESLLGRLMADNYGGVARVLDVTSDGETLLMIDSLGKRYEVGRAEVRSPTAADFEMCRVGMSFDPARQPDAHCAHCRQAASNAEGGKWYRMGWKNFCSPCATEYAAEEGYLKDDEINSELEQVG